MGLSPGVLSPMPPPEEADMADAAAVVLERPVASRFDAAAAQDAGLDTSASAEQFRPGGRGSGSAWRSHRSSAAGR